MFGAATKLDFGGSGLSMDWIACRRVSALVAVSGRDYL